MTMSPQGDLDTLIDAGEVAKILGLAHRTSVSTYANRHVDFPAAQLVPGCGRTRYWIHGEILAWHRDFQARKSAAANQPRRRLDDLVATTTRLLLGSPGQEISIRQIAAEAGVPHSDLYRYITSKDQLIDLAIARIEQSMKATIPTDYQVFYDNPLQLLLTTHAEARAMRVLTDRALRGELGPTSTDMALSAMADVIGRRPGAAGVPTSVDHRVLAMCIVAMMWGLNVLEPQWLAALELDEIPDNQVAATLRAMLDATV